MTRIPFLSLDKAAKYRRICNTLVDTAEATSAEEIVLYPGTTCQELAKKEWKNRRDVKAFYVTRQPAPNGHYHEITVFGYEILNPRKRPTEHADWLIELAKKMVGHFTVNYEVNAMHRYETEGFEILCDHLGAQRRVCSGRPHESGYGFEITIERILML
jgi:hypothetical protein